MWVSSRMPCCCRSAYSRYASDSGTCWLSVPCISSHTAKGGSVPVVMSHHRVSVSSSGISRLRQGVRAACSLRSWVSLAVRRFTSAASSLMCWAVSSSDASAASSRYSRSEMRGRGVSRPVFWGGAVRRRMSMADCSCLWRASRSAAAVSHRRRVSGSACTSGSLISRQPMCWSRRSMASWSRSSASTCKRFILTMAIYRFTTFSSR